MAFAFYCFTKACEIIWSKACNEMLVLCTVKLMFNHLFCEKNLYIPTNVGYNLSFVKKKKKCTFLTNFTPPFWYKGEWGKMCHPKKMFCILIFERKVISFIVNQYLHVKVQFATKQVKIV